jgi:hypothetical protein
MYERDKRKEARVEYKKEIILREILIGFSHL